MLVKLDDKLSKKIESLITNKNGSVFHEPKLNKIISEKFGSELYYLIDNSEDIQNTAPVHITKTANGLTRYNISPLRDIPYSGFIGESIIETKDFNIGNFESLSYVGFPYVKKSSNSPIKNMGETAMVDLRLSEDEIFTKIIHSKRRNMIRKARKEGISIKHYFTVDGLKLFWPILESLHQKLGYNDLTYDYYEKIFEAYSHKKQAFVMLAFKDKKPISGVFILGNQNYMHYYKGASVVGVRNQGQGELLQWEAIKLSKSLGAKYYDLCNLSKEKLPEIYRFKTGISKNIYQYQIFSYNSLSYKVVNRINKYIKWL